MTSQGMTECLHITDQTALLVGLYFTLYLQVIGRPIYYGPQADCGPGAQTGILQCKKCKICTNKQLTTACAAGPDLRYWTYLLYQ